MRETDRCITWIGSGPTQTSEPYGYDRAANLSGNERAAYERRQALGSANTRYTFCTICDTYSDWPSGERSSDDVQRTHPPVLTIGHLGCCQHCPAEAREAYAEIRRRGSYIEGDARREVRRRIGKDG